jgi:hypothetical protein
VYDPGGSNSDHNSHTSNSDYSGSSQCSDSDSSDCVSRDSPLPLYPTPCDTTRSVSSPLYDQVMSTSSVRAGMTTSLTTVTLHLPCQKRRPPRSSLPMLHHSQPFQVLDAPVPPSYPTPTLCRTASTPSTTPPPSPSPGLLRALPLINRKLPGSLISTKGSSLNDVYRKSRAGLFSGISWSVIDRWSTILASSR